jgi:hypothetical protein
VVAEIQQPELNEVLKQALIWCHDGP